MSRLSKRSPSVCTDLPLDNPDICQKLNVLRQLLRSCFGPTGRLKQVHNNIGGHVITTSTSSVLLQAVSTSQPLLKLIIASVLNHVSRFSDCGLFAANLCLTLIGQAKQSGLRSSVAISVNKQLLGMCTSYLNQEDCGCKMKINFSSSQNLITLARSVISSKPACMLTGKEALHISILAVQAFLLTVPCDSPGKVSLGRILTVPIEGHSLLDSAVFPGLLVEMPDVLYPSNVENIGSGPLRLVLFSTSLSGDLFDVGEGSLEVHQGEDMESQILERLLALGEQVVKDEVIVFACQKVIHPVLQHHLRRHGIVVVERLGIALMEPFTQLTGAQPVATLQTTIPPEAYGQVKGLSMKRFGSKVMLHLQPMEEPVVCTMVLCHRNETMLSELKVVCQKTEQVLKLTLREPSALLGGGCTETHLAAYIRNKSINEASEAAAALGCSQTDYLRGVEAFCLSLQSAAQALEHDGGDSLIDLTHGHHRTVPADEGHLVGQDEIPGSCGCGLVESRPGHKWTYLNTEYPKFSPALLSRDGTSHPQVLDSFTAKLNALQVGVETANLVLDIRYVIEDVN